VAIVTHYVAHENSLNPGYYGMTSNRVLAWVSSGEEVAITKHRRTVARLLPAHNPKNGGRADADIAGRLQKGIGRKVVSDKAMGRCWAKAGVFIESVR